MMSTCFTLQSQRAPMVDLCFRRCGPWTLTLVIVVVGCAPKSDVPVGDAAENIRKLALGYVQYASTNRGIGPADEETLTKFIAQRNMITPEEVKPWFISPRDNEPFVIRWAMRPMVPDPTGVKGPTPNTIIYEKTGAGGTRVIANGQMSVQELSAEDFSQAVPDHNNSSP